MRTLLARRALGAAALLLAANGCATAASDGSAGGAGGAGATETVATISVTASISTASSSSSSSSKSSATSTAASTAVSSSATGPNNCGNGMIDPGESCDGTDFGGKTCVDYGFQSGALVCNSFCGTVVSGCLPAENCTNQVDDDMDGLIDCDDPDCATATACTDPCSAPVTIVSGFSGQIDGRPNVLSSSCMPQAGREIVFSYTAPTSNDVSVQVLFADFDPGLAIRTTCGDPASELICANHSNSDTESLSFSATAGQTYFIVMESVNNAPGFYDIQVNNILPESLCTDLADNDFDGYVDCDDATACKGTADCVGGATAVGQYCSLNTDCASVNGDPVCLTNQLGYANGYCSEFCNLAANDCPGTAQCVQIGLSNDGVCMEACTLDTNCAPGYSCVDRGVASKVCDKPPELNCDDTLDNDNDGLVDCEDPTACTSSPSCVPGPGAVGTACQLHNQCQANANDPYCIDQTNFGWPGGYCSEFCDMQTNDCQSGDACSSWFFFQSGHGLCLKTCMLDTDCRPGYNCLSDGVRLVCAF